MSSPSIHSQRRAFSIMELLILIIMMTTVIAIMLPMLGGVRSSSQIEQSMSNLITIGFAHATYAADWDGRQVTFVVDDISTYGPSMPQALNNYEHTHGESHPSIIAGWAYDSVVDFVGLYAFWPDNPTAQWAYQPLQYTTGFEVGNFRIWSHRPWHDYVNGRCSDPTFYAPADDVQHPIVEPFFDSPWEFDVELNGTIGWPTYVLSPAAYFSPEVMRSSANGGYQSPFSIPDGFTTPSLSAARYPNLKTQMLEYWWLQNRPRDPCNPAYVGGTTFDDCEPWNFNHGIDSAPVTLFYDMSVRLLPNEEAIAADQKVVKQTGYGLWSRDTPFLEFGFLGEFSYDGAITSHHILTTDGIHGRDTISR